MNVYFFIIAALSLPMMVQCGAEKKDEKNEIKGKLTLTLITKEFRQEDKPKPVSKIPSLKKKTPTTPVNINEITRRKSSNPQPFSPKGSVDNVIERLEDGEFNDSL